ncbi:uncharacterized protein EV420DRAFT_107837 [Desarmillaria tabescens]|uniref:Uncharacterized protein n=1 Tax=Armillaria tabescens TaxID=1929756 RepID=A0AA39TYU5_ARMTA|nr:uncharacterized protein EV420DRAFT_107837 [Desarmillaria tabescens]KAK0470338.1 hypothetical protein EV420DRAFT_107837 [Desarmillaria tabescens]
MKPKTNYPLHIQVRTGILRLNISVFAVYVRYHASYSFRTFIFCFSVSSSLDHRGPRPMVSITTCVSFSIFLTTTKYR